MNKITVHRWARNQRAEDYAPSSNSPPMRTTRQTKKKLNSFNSHCNDQYRVRLPIYPCPPSINRYPRNYSYFRSPSGSSSRCLAGWCCTIAVILAIILAIFTVLITIFFISFGMEIFGIADTSSPGKTPVTKKPIVPNKTANDTDSRKVIGSVVIHGVVAVNDDDDILQFTFHVASVNATEAALHCSIDGHYLVTFDRANDEKDLMREVKNHPTFLRQCADAFIGYRTIQDREWVSVTGDHEAFGGLFSSMWESTVYESGQENCSHAAKVFDYRLNTISCNFPHDCVMCQTDVNCAEGKTPCFKLEKFPVSSVQRASIHCEKKIKGILAIVPNAKTHEALLETLKRQDPDQTCVAVAIGMILHRRLESFKEVIAKYPPLSLNAAMSPVSDSCVAIILRGDGVKSIKFVDCRKRTCFVCATRLRTNPTLTTVK